MGVEKMKLIVFVMGFILILGSITLLIALPDYTPDEIRFILIIVPILTAMGLVFKL